MTSLFPSTASKKRISLFASYSSPILGLMLLLPACSTGTADSNANAAATGSLQKPAALQNGATAHASSRRDAQNCRNLIEPINSELARLNSVPTILRSEAEETPLTLSALFARSSDPVRSLPAYKDYTATRARLEVQNKEVSAVGCPPVDLNDRLAKTDKLLNSGLWRYGTEAEAKSMLGSAFADLARDREKALRRIQARWEPFKSRDVEVSCADRGTGTIVTSRSGRDSLADLRDARQAPLGLNLAKAASGASATVPKEVTFAALSPDGRSEVTRVAFVAQNETLICWTSAIRG